MSKTEHSPLPTSAELRHEMREIIKFQRAAIAELVDMVERLQDSLHVAYCEVDCDDPEEGCVEECIDARALIAKHKAKP